MGFRSRAWPGALEWRAMQLDLPDLAHDARRELHNLSCPRALFLPRRCVLLVIIRSRFGEMREKLPNYRATPPMPRNNIVAMLRG